MKTIITMDVVALVVTVIEDIIIDVEDRLYKIWIRFFVWNIIKCYYNYSNCNKCFKEHEKTRCRPSLFLC